MRTLEFITDHVIYNLAIKLYIVPVVAHNH